MDRPRRLDAIAITAMAVLFSLYFCWFIRVFSAYPFDDAYIHMRIARNLAFYGQPYFNLGEAVMGTSPHLWVAILALLFRLFGPNPNIAVALECVFTIGSFILGAFVLSERVSRPKAMILSGLLISVYLLNIGASLMELPLALFLWLCSILAFQRRRFGLFGLFCGLTMAVRYEFVIWACLGLWGSSKNWRAFIKGIIGPVAVIFGACFLFYRTIVPEPMLAKWIVFRPHRSTLLMKFSFPYLNDWRLSRVPALELPNENAFDFKHLLAQTGLICLLGYLINPFSGKPMSPWARLAGVFSAVLGALYLFGNTPVLPWYYPITLFPLAFASFSSTRGKGWLVAIVYMLSTSGWWLGGMRDACALWERNWDLYTYYRYNARTVQYLDIGEELQKKYPSALVCGPDIGGLGWTFHGKILDALGYVSPESLKYYASVPYWKERPNLPLNLPLLPIQLVIDYKPDIIVSMTMYSSDFIQALGKPGFPRYRLIEQRAMFPNPRLQFRGHRAIEIYRLDKSS